MGLKKSNYRIEEIGINMPTAYAYIRNIYVNGEKGVAEFVIQASRETAINLYPIKTVRIEFDVNRDENAFYTAYNAAKKMAFFGWQDDFVKA